MSAQRPEGSPPKPPSLLITAGWFVIIASFVFGCLLVVAEFLFFADNPYFSLVTYTLPPGLMSFGGVLLVLGLIRRWRRLQQRHDPKPLPVLDLNAPRVHVLLIGCGVGIVIFMGVSGLATYRGYHFTESTEFCGTVCHSVMEPEYVAHSRSPHSRVECVACHIGPGADWYVRSKMDGLRQVYRVATHTYKLPIATPLHNLRPARDTCERCHWPAKFEGSTERVLWRYWFDKESTPSRYHMLLKVGGVNQASGRPEGIHWHSNSGDQVYYWARDEAREDIPWVDVVHPDGTHTIYKDDSLSAPPPKEELRLMDCMDCHNRPAHIFRSPNDLVDAALSKEKLDRKVPYVKRNAVEILSMTFKSKEEARATIQEEVERRYAEGLAAERRQQLVADLYAIYDVNNFPLQGVHWRTYPSHLGHKTSPGCYRCHDGKHQAEGGTAISHQCANCHDFIYQAHGAAAYGPVTYETRPFEHPGEETSDYETQLCSDCHHEKVGWYPGHVDGKRDPNARPRDPE